ncbi:MAG: acyl carrier protein [Lachnospirales bacterium]
MFEEIREMVAEQLGIDEETIKIDTDLIGELDCDSLDLFQLVSEVEDKYDVKIEDLENLKTIGDLIKSIEG